MLNFRITNHDVRRPFTLSMYKSPKEYACFSTLIFFTSFMTGVNDFFTGSFLPFPRSELEDFAPSFEVEGLSGGCTVEVLHIENSQ